MDDLRERIARLTPEQRSMLARRVESAAGARAGAGLPAASPLPRQETNGRGRELKFGLFFFYGQESDRPDQNYRLLVEAARIADQEGFEAVWTPERHFHPLGGLYPNPALLASALAMVTERIGIRAGSVVLPLHDPLRIAEEWAVVDNLSGGRAGMSFASGWRPDDFALAPARYERRRQLTFEGIETVRRLWRGETLRVPSPNGDREIQVFPRPVQAEPPVWLTCAGSAETWAMAARLGAGVLTAVLAQSMEDLARNIGAYRRLGQESGPDGRRDSVTLVLHTYVGAEQEDVRSTVREPFSRYLETHVSIHEAVKVLADAHIDVDGVTAADRRALVDFAFERYVRHGALIGDEQHCLARLAHLESIGVDEVACQIDFGLRPEIALAGLHRLVRVVSAYRSSRRPALEPEAPMGPRSTGGVG